MNGTKYKSVQNIQIPYQMMTTFAYSSVLWHPHNSDLILNSSVDLAKWRDVQWLRLSSWFHSLLVARQRILSNRNSKYHNSTMHIQLNKTTLSCTFKNSSHSQEFQKNSYRKLSRSVIDVNGQTRGKVVFLLATRLQPTKPQLNLNQLQSFNISIKTEHNNTINLYLAEGILLYCHQMSLIMEHLTAWNSLLALVWSSEPRDLWTPCDLWIPGDL